jgi:hypothetical protein
MKRIAAVALALTVGTGCGSSHQASRGTAPSTATHTSLSVPPSSTPRVTTTAAPVLGRTWLVGCPDCQRGFGEVRPKTIFLGGDGTGVVQHVHWLSWGEDRAIGSGIGRWLGPNQFSYQATPAAATVVAFNLGTCRGRRAYTAIAWYFPQHGQHFDPSTHINICTGEYVGDNGAVPPSP